MKILLKVIGFQINKKMKKFLNLIYKKSRELKNNDELKLAALSGFTIGVILVYIIYNIL